MPFGWFQFSAASSELVDRYRERPTELERKLRRDLEDAGARLECGLWFDDDDMAFAVVKDLDRAEPAKRRGLIRAYEAEYWKLYDAEQAEQGQAYERELLGDTGFEPPEAA